MVGFLECSFYATVPWLQAAITHLEERVDTFSGKKIGRGGSSRSEPTYGRVLAGLFNVSASVANFCHLGHGTDSCPACDQVHQALQ